MIDLFVSASFLDDAEVTPAMREAMLLVLREFPEIKHVNVESRADRISQTGLEQLRIHHETTGHLFQVGFGFESQDDLVRNVALNKGLSLQQLENAAAEVTRWGLGLTLNVFYKPPFLTEREAMEESWASLNEAARLLDGYCGAGAGTIVLMVANHKPGSFTEWLSRREGLSLPVRYRLPSLWSVIEVVRCLDPSVRDRTLIYGFAAAVPLQVMAQGCESCTARVMEAIERFNLDPTSGAMEGLGAPCQCHTEYLDKEPKEMPPLEERIDDYLGMIEQEMLSLSNNGISIETDHTHSLDIAQKELLDYENIQGGRYPMALQADIYSLYDSDKLEDLLSLMDAEKKLIDSKTADVSVGEACRLAMLAAFKLDRCAEAEFWRVRALVRFIRSPSKNGLATLVLAEAFSAPDEERSLVVLDEMNELIDPGEGATRDFLNPELLLRLFHEKRGHFLRLLGRLGEAVDAYKSALGHCGSDERGRLKVQGGLALCRFQQAQGEGNSKALQEAIDETSRVCTEATDQGHLGVAKKAEKNLDAMNGGTALHPYETT